MSSQFLEYEFINNNPAYIRIYPKQESGGAFNLSNITHFTRIPSTSLPVGWEDVLYYRFIGSSSDHSSVKNGFGGYVYVLINNAFPNKCKIGMTTLQPQKRLQQINSTGVMDDWELGFSYKCSRPYDLEKAIHLKLSNLRSRMDREFFEIKIGDAIELIEDMGEMFTPL